MPFKDIERQRESVRRSTRKWRAKNRAILKEREAALNANAVWYGDLNLWVRKARQRAGVCVVCARPRPVGRWWCCSKEHERLRREHLG